MAVKKAIKAKKKPVKRVKANKAPTKKVVAKKISKPKKVVKTKSSNTIANNKSKIAPYKTKKNEKYMSAAMKRHFIAVLMLWKEHLKEEMQKTFDHLRTKGETFADPVDRASQEEEFALNSEQETEKESSLIKLVFR